MRIVAILTIVAALAILTASTGCAEARKMKTQQPLLDAKHVDLKQSPHVSLADDPCPADPSKPPVGVLKAGPLKGEPYATKCTFIREKGFFVMPASGKADLHVVVAMHKLLGLRMQVTAKPKGSQTFTKVLPAGDQWQEVIFQLDSARITPGSTVYDITIWQEDKDKKADKDTTFYVKSITVQME